MTSNSDLARKVVSDLIAEERVSWAARYEAEKRVERTLDEAGKG